MHDLDEYSHNVGVGPIDETFLLSRAKFIAAQVSNVKCITSAKCEEDLNIGDAFANYIIKNRASMICQQLRAKSTIKKRKRASIDQKRKKEIFGVNRHFDTMVGKMLNFPNDDLIWPMDDSELLCILGANERGTIKLPSSIKRIKYTGIYDPIVGLPLPPVPMQALSLCDDLSCVGLDNDALGSLLSSYQVLSMFKEHLNLPSFGLEEFVKCVIFRPENEAIPSVIFESKCMISESLKLRNQKNNIMKKVIDHQTPAFCSPLFVQIIMKLLQFILKQPENAELLRIVQSGDDICETANIPSKFNKLTWQRIVIDVIVFVDQCPLPEELDTIELRSKSDNSQDRDVPGFSANPQTVPTLRRSTKRKLKSVFLENDYETHSSPCNLEVYLEEQAKLEASYPQTTEAYMLNICKGILEELFADIRSAPFVTKVDPGALGIPNYFEVINKPMDLGLVNDRLYSGFYRPDNIEFVRMRFTNQLHNVELWKESLYSVGWNRELLFEAKRFLDYVDREVLVVVPSSFSDQEIVLFRIQEVSSELRWLMSQRALELYQQDIDRKRSFELVSGKLDIFGNCLSRGISSLMDLSLVEKSTVDNILSLQHCVLLDPVLLTFHLDLKYQL